MGTSHQRTARSSFGSRIGPALTTTGLVAVVVTAWELVVRFEIVNPVLTSSPWRVAKAIPRVLRHDAIARDAVQSLSSFATGLAVALCLGLAIGIAMGVSRFAHALFNPLFVVTNAIPKVALMPIIVLWVGIGMKAAVALSAIMAAFPILSAVRTAVTAMDPSYGEVARAFGASRGLTLRQIVLPSVLPYFLGGLRVAINYALVGVLLAEFFAASRGVGYRMMASMQNFEVDVFFVLLTAVAAFALVLTALIGWAERGTAYARA